MHPNNNVKFGVKASQLGFCADVSLLAYAGHVPLQDGKSHLVHISLLWFRLPLGIATTPSKQLFQWAF